MQVVGAFWAASPNTLGHFALHTRASDPTGSLTRLPAHARHSGLAASSMTLEAAGGQVGRAGASGRRVAPPSNDCRARTSGSAPTTNMRPPAPPAPPAGARAPAGAAPGAGAAPSAGGGGGTRQRRAAVAVVATHSAPDGSCSARRRTGAASSSSSSLVRVASCVLRRGAPALAEAEAGAHVTLSVGQTADCSGARMDCSHMRSIAESAVLPVARDRRRAALRAGQAPAPTQGQHALCDVSHLLVPPRWKLRLHPDPANSLAPKRSRAPPRAQPCSAGQPSGGACAAARARRARAGRAPVHAAVAAAREHEAEVGRRRERPDAVGVHRERLQAALLAQVP